MNSLFKISQDLYLATNAYIDYIKENYRKNSPNGKHQLMILCFDIGKKFIKITEVTDSGQLRVHSFIVINDFVSGKSSGYRSFKAGDILMAANFKQPALNKARGNILERNYGKTSWTGAGYL